MARQTIQRALILNVMLEVPLAEWYGLELSKEAGLKSGTIYPALAALEKGRLLTSRWEDVDPKQVGRPRRRLYRLAPDRIGDINAYVAEFPVVLRPSAETVRRHRPGLARGRFA